MFWSLLINLFLAFFAFSKTPCDGLFLKMEDQYRGEEKKGVVYLQGKQGLSSAFRVKIENGELRYRRLQQDDYHFADGRQEDGKLSDGDYFFVTSLEGDLYAAKNELSAQFIEENKRLRHSSFLSSGDVRGAGHFYLENGLITQINNRSGHYVPDGLNLFRNYLQLKKKGLRFSEDATMTIAFEEENTFFDIRLSALSDLKEKDLDRFSVSDFHWEIYQRSKKEPNIPLRLNKK